jgi:hypothetical protein
MPAAPAAPVAPLMVTVVVASSGVMTTLPPGELHGDEVVLGVADDAEQSRAGQGGGDVPGRDVPGLKRGEGQERPA